MSVVLMVGAGTRWALTVLFAITGTWYLIALARCVAGFGRSEWRSMVGAVAHVLMSVAMIAMFWAWGVRIPTIAQVTVFTGTAAWFIAQVLLTDPASSSAAGDLLPERTSNHPTGSRTARMWRLDGWYHAAMAAAMVWMAVAMATMTTPPIAVVTTADGPTSGMSMPGMSMPGISMPGASNTDGAGWVSIGCLGLCVVFSAAAVWYVVTALRSLATGGGRVDAPLLAHDAVGALMATGMAVAFHIMS